MEKETLLSQLNEKIGSTNLTARTISEYVDAIYPTITTDDQVNDSFFDVHTKILSTMGGQLRHEISEEVKKFRETYKPDTKPTTKTEGKDNQGDDPLKEIRESLNSLAAENKTLKEKIELKEKLESQESLKKRVIELMKKDKANDEAVLDYTFKGETLDTAQSAETLAQKYIKLYDEAFLKIKGSGAAPRSSSSSGGGGGSSDLDGLFERKAAQGKFPKKE